MGSSWPSPRRRDRASAAIGLGLLVASALGVAACGSDPCDGPTCPGAPASGGSGGSTSGSGGSTSGTARSGPCESDATCDVAHGFSCTVGGCRHACASHFDCLGQGLCEPLADGDGAPVGTYCALFEQPSPAGQYYSSCPKGEECDANAGFTCLGAGPGDADAYCSASCQTDPDCPAGFFCDSLTDSNGDPVSFCVRRRFCAPCATDADCLGVAGQVCARDRSGEKICTTSCDENVDSCPWGNASICALHDPELGVPTCAHRFGSCHGEGKGCEPCVRDSDCPRGFCSGSNYTSERWCVDSTVACDCDGLDTSQHVCQDGNGCPKTPGNLAMMCYDNSRGEGDPIAFSCFAANTTGTTGLASPQSGCWGPL